jgi:hypothetical protein
MDATLTRIEATLERMEVKLPTLPGTRWCLWLMVGVTA